MPLGSSAGGGGVITALNSATANELVTIGATTTELESETDLLFDNTIKELRIYNDNAAGDNDEYAALGWNESANTFRIDTKNTGTGTARHLALFSATGFVGVGKHVPQHMLDVNGNLGVLSHVYFDGTANRMKRNGNNLYIQGNVGIQFATNSEDYHMYLDTDGDLLIGMTASSSVPEVTAILELRSTTKGFLPPRMNGTERDAITDPAEGMVIYNTDTNVLNFVNDGSGTWAAV
jgi:hypothetical protein